MADLAPKFAYAASAPLPRAFARAARHSRHVRIARIALPLAAAAGLLGMIASALAPQGHGGPAAPELVLPSAGVSMDRPKLAGFNRDGRAYEITAAQAAQRIDAPTEILLSALTARMDLQDKGWARLEAPEGRLESKQQTLDLARGAEIVTHAGDVARLDDGRVDLQAGRIVSDQPVALRTGGTTLTADRMEMSGSGKSVVFEGRVVMVMHPAAEVAAAPAMPGTPR